MKFDDEPETMKELREVKREIAGEVIAYFREAGEKFKKETGINLPRLQKTVKK